MSQHLTIGANLGAGLAAQAANIRAQLRDEAGATVGSLVSTGFTEIGDQGTYQWYYAAYPDGFEGTVEFSISGTVYSVVGINDADFGKVTSSTTGGATYYVAKTGNDSTGDGTRATPWLTISKAYLAAASGDTIKVGDGTYQENTSASGYFQIARTFTDWVTIESESGVPSAVTIQGASNATFNVYTNSTANAYLRLKNLTFTPRLATNNSAIRIDRTDRLELINCYATAPSDATGSKFALHLVTNGATAINGLTVEGGVYSGGTVTNAHGIFGQGVSGSGTIGAVGGITFRDVWADGVLSALSLSGDVTGILVDGGRYTSTGNAGISLGVNSATSAGTLTGTLRGFVVDQSGTGSGIALLIGAGCVGVVVEDFDIRAGNYGVQVRGNTTVPTTGTVIRDGTIRGGGNASAASGSAVYWRGVTAGRVERCQLSKRAGVNGVVQVGADGTAAGTITCVDNTIISYGGLALEWGTAGASGDSGGSINDRNLYDLRGPAATLGSVYGTTGILTMGALRAAWATYSVTTNDAKSTMAPPSAEYYTANRAAALDTLGRVLYVRKTGNDTSGDGSSGAPYLTISKAQAEAIEGDTVRIGDGTYQEDTASSGLFTLNRLFTRYVTFESESGDPETVLIQGASNATFNTLTATAGASYYRFRNVSFTPRLTTNTSACRLSRADHFELVNCRGIAPTTVTAPTKFAFHIATSGSTVRITNVLFQRCKWNTAGNTNAHGCFVTGALASTSDIEGIRFEDCEADGHLSALTLVDTVNGIEIDGGEYRSTGSYGIRVGQDAATPLSVQTGFIKRAIVSTEFGTGHGLLLGADVTADASGVDFLVENCDVRGADYGIVVKECDNVTVRNTVSRGGLVSATNGSALYNKGAQTCLYERNTLLTYQGNQATVQIGKGDSPGNTQFQNITLRENTIIAFGVRALDWGDSTEDAGGGVVDQNLYSIFGTNGTIGDVRTTTGIVSIAALRAAWDSYGAGTNDERSELATDHTPSPLITATINATDIENAVWNADVSSHAVSGSFGSLVGGVIASTAAAVWAYTTRTLTMTAAAIVEAITSSGRISIRRANTATVNLTGLGDLSDRTKLYVTVKESVNDPDSAAILQWEETAGLLRLNGAAATASDGTLTVTNAVLGNITLTLKPSAAAQLELQDRLIYDVKKLVGTNSYASDPSRFEVDDNVTSSVT